MPNQAPTANAGPDKVVELNGATTATFTLLGSGTDDGNIQPLSYQWFEGGSPVGNATPSLTLTRGLGIYNFTLTDFDGELSGNDSARVTVVDPTPPLVSAIVSGPAGSPGWYTGEVAVTWKVVDRESSITSPACPDIVLKDDGANQALTCFAESAGGKTNGATSINIDAAPPVVTVPANLVVPAIDTLTPVTYSGESATDATSGLASFGCAPASGSNFPLGPTTVNCTAVDGAGHSASESFTVTVAPAQTSISLMNLPGTALVGNGSTLPVSAMLTRTSAPAGPLAIQSVTFTLNGPEGTSQLTATTDASGSAVVAFPTTMRGDYSITASFAGDPTLKTSTSATVIVRVIQRTKLVVSPAAGSPGSPVTVSATLLAIPQDTPIAGLGVILTTGGNPTTVTPNGSTDANGVTSTTLIFPATGSFVSMASFSNYVNHFGDANGAPSPTTATGTVTITSAATSLAPLQLAQNHFVGDSLTVATTLNRITSPAGPLNGAPITFTLSGPSGTQVAGANTTATGAASVTFTLQARGVHTVTAQFAGDACTMAPQ